MPCTETNCACNCCGFCQRIDAIKDYLEYDIPEPDGCPMMTPKVMMSEEC
ncbi:hypothetical protein bpr_II028 (plasmid) [Butyrivibrio proteoclasticus B316]|uniref:Uncharacterized protein n=1 Tax=Butyrivibrio proteoclasticus (strain ATCC 51982 / DSM 14932 / B316) TaxID=515622 RepID=E0S3I6_BUTPB|nr:hypothetical protein [Butyrivibrio proteoclasticus]ADL35968.1 hypothetical protein bpr_II028 [Butyrivibrio proteoclasticus B316]